MIIFDAAHKHIQHHRRNRCVADVLEKNERLETPGTLTHQQNAARSYFMLGCCKSVVLLPCPAIPFTSCNRLLTTARLCHNGRSFYSYPNVASELPISLMKIINYGNSLSRFLRVHTKFGNILPYRIGGFGNFTLFLHKICLVLYTIFSN